MHIVSTFPAKNAEIFALFSDIVHLCGQNLVQPEIYTFKNEIHVDSNFSKLEPVTYNFLWGTCKS